MNKKKKKSTAVVSTTPISLIVPKKIPLESDYFLNYVSSCERDLTSNAQKIRQEWYSDDITKEIFERTFLTLVKSYIKNIK